MPPTDQVNFGKTVNLVAAAKGGSILPGAAECVWLAPVARWPKSRFFIVVVVRERLLLQGWNGTKAKPPRSGKSASTRLVPHQTAAFKRVSGKIKLQHSPDSQSHSGTTSFILHTQKQN